MKTYMKLIFKAFIIGLISVVCYTQASSTHAATSPSVIVPEQDKEIYREKGQSQFDIKTLFTIDSGMYTENQLIIGYSISLDDTLISHDNLVIDFVDGEYTLTILIVGNNVFIGSPVSQSITFTLVSVPPSFLNAEAMQEVRTINIQKNQGFIDLRILYNVTGNSFEDEWVITYDVKYPGRTIDIFGDFIKSISGVYTITVIINSVDGAFPEVKSVPMTVIVQKNRPEVVFEYATESGKTVIQDEHTIYTYAGSQYVDLTEFFTVYGNAYVRNEYAYSLIVKKEVSGEGLVNCQVFDGYILPLEGTYHVTVKVNPKIQGAFTPVTSDTILFNVVKAIPKVNDRGTVVINRYDTSKKELQISNIFSVSNNAYSSNQYTVSYQFSKDGKTLVPSDGLIKLSNGEWEVRAVVSANNDEFADQVTQVTLLIDFPMDALTLGLIIGLSSLCVCGGIATILILNRRKKL